MRDVFPHSVTPQSARLLSPLSVSEMFTQGASCLGTRRAVRCSQTQSIRPAAGFHSAEVDHFQSCVQSETRETTVKSRNVDFCQREPAELPLKTLHLFHQALQQLTELSSDWAGG